MKSGDRCQRGQVIVWVAVMLPFFLAVIGLASDGGLVFEQRQALQSLADEAARTGANQLDQAAYRADGVSVLDPAAARQAADAYLVAQSPELTGTVVADQQRVIVRVQRQIPTGFLRIVHITSVTIGATATAEVRHGIAKGTP